jgi:hypothetical protein
MWFAYINCWATDVFSFGPPLDYISSPVVNQKSVSRQQAEVIQNHENAYLRNIGQGEHRHRKYKRLKLGGGQAYDRSND